MIIYIISLISKKYQRKMKQTIIIEVSQEEDGGFVAECLTEDIFTQGDTWEELKLNVMEAVKGYYFDQPEIPDVKLHLVKDEILVLQ
jgi:predicted RNase H-like HicB family nuclease